jgi:hypothetical protein
MQGFVGTGRDCVPARGVGRTCSTRSRSYGPIRPVPTSRRLRVIMERIARLPTRKELAPQTALHHCIMVGSIDWIDPGSSFSGGTACESSGHERAQGPFGYSQGPRRPERTPAQQRLAQSNILTARSWAVSDPARICHMSAASLASSPRRAPCAVRKVSRQYLRRPASRLSLDAGLLAGNKRNAFYAGWLRHEPHKGGS